MVFFGIKIYTHYKSSQYAETAVPYVKMVVPEISKWDPAIIKKYMSNDSLSDIPQEKMDKVLAYLSKLGGLKKMDEPEFSGEDSNVMISDRQQTIVTYKIKVEYENGSAVFTIALLNQGQDFQVQNFNINSKALFQ